MSGLLVSPLGIGLLLLALLAATRRWLPLVLRIAVTGLLLLTLLATTALGANALAGLVERHAHAHDCAANGNAPIIVLAGGHGHQPADAQDYSALNLASLRRLFGAVQLHRLQPDRPLIMVGGGKYRPSEAQLMIALAQGMGVNEIILRSETESADTWENAMHVAAMRPPLAQPVWLVTSALHMPRARFAFEAAGIRTCASPVDYRARALRGWADLLPSSNAIALSEAALHELFGMVYYRWRLFRQPQPDDAIAD